MAGRRPLRWTATGAGIVTAFIFGAMFGGCVSAPDIPSGADIPSDGSAKPSPTVIRETVTRIEYALPKPCKQALLEVQNIISGAASVASAHTAQLDIMDEAFQAILQKDWKKLNDLTDRQRELDRSLAGDKVKFLPSQIQVQKDIRECVDSAPLQEE